MDKQERFSIRKLTVGVASVTIGFWLAGSGNVAHADTVDGNVNQTEVKTDNISVDKTAVQSANTDTEQDVKNQTNNSDVVKSTDTEFAKSGQEKDQMQTNAVNNSTQAGIADPATNSTSPIGTAKVVANDKTNLVNGTLSSSTQTSRQLDNTSAKTNVSNQVTTDNHYVGGQHIKIDDAFKDAFPKSFTVDDSLKYKDIAETQFKNNTYQSDPVAKTESVDVYNLTNSQLTRINKYTTDIINNLRHQVGIDSTEDYKVNTDLMKWQQNQTKKQAELNMWGHNAEYLHGAGENVGALSMDNTTGRLMSELKPSDFNFTYDPNAKTITTWSPVVSIKTMDDLYAFSYYMTSIFMFEDYGGEANSHAENFTFTNRGPKQYSELGIYPATDPNTKKTNLFFRWIVPNVDTFNAANVDGNKNNISADPGPVNKQVIHLIDDTNSADKLNDMVISNPAGTVLNVSIKPPANYVLAENNTLPSTFDFTNGDLPDLTVHVKHNIETVNDTRNNATETIKIHYVDNKGNKLKDDTTVKFTFHRDYTIDKATGKSTIGAWEYVPNSMTQSGTYIKDIGEPGKHYNSVNGYDSFNFWIPFNVAVDGYSQKYSGLTASFSIPNGPEYLYDRNVNVDQNIVYEPTRKEYFTINIYDDDLGVNGEPIGVVGTVNPTSSEGYATVAYKWPNNAKASLADYIISQIPDLPDKVTIAGDFWKTLKVGDDATSLSYPNWRVSDMNDVAGKTFTIHIKSKAPAQIQVTYRFVANGQQVGQYQTDTFNTDKTYTIDTNKFKSSIPNHYYLDSKYQIPTSVKYTDGMKANTVIDVPVYKANVYTIKFYDDTENEQSGRFYDEQSGSYDGISWDGITDKRLTGTIADLQALIDSHVEKLTHDSNAYRQKLDVAKTPAVATVTGYDLKDDDTGNVTSGSAVPVVADLPHTDSTITIHFVHNFLDFTGKAPLYTASSIMLKDVNSANKLANVLNKQFAEYSSLMNITIDDLRDALNGAKWTSGGTIVENNEYGTIFQADGNEASIFSPTASWRTNINNTTKILPDAFWTDKIENMNNGNHDGTILGNPYLVPIKVHADLFSHWLDNSTVHADLSEPLTLKTADTLKPGYHYEVLVGNKTGYEYIPVNSTVLQNASTIPDQINMLANLMGTKTLSTNSDLKDVDVSSIVDTSMTTPMSLKLVQTETGNYEYQLENPAFGLLDQQNFASMDINGLVPYLSPMYKEALENVVKQSGMSDVEVAGGTYYIPPAIMLYVAVPNDETATIKYIDDDTNTVLKTDTVNGKTDKLIEFNDDPSIVINDFEKQGYKVVSNTYKSGIHFGTTNDFEIHLTKKIDNIINYVDENGKVVKTDKVTDLPGSNIKLDIPDGYHVDGQVPNLTINSKTPVQTVNVIENKHETGIPETSDKDVLNIVNYVDENGKIVKTDKITGKDGDNIKIVIPDGYHIDGQVPNLKINSKTPVQTVNVIENKHETGIPETSDRDVLNIVNYVDENGKIVKTDKITGKDGDSIKIVIPDGYHIDGQVPNLTINSKTPVQTVNVVTNKHETGIPETNDKDVLNIVNYVNENGKIVKTDKITGKDGDSIKIVIPDGYHIDGQVPNLTVNSKTPIQTVNIVKDKYETGIPETNDKDVLNIVNYVNENGKIVKTDKITGKDGDNIKIVIPDGYHIDGQVPNLTINSKTPVQTVNVIENKHETGIPETSDKDVLNIVNYVNENGETVKTDKITGKDGDNIKIVIPDGYHIDGQVPNLTINSKTPVQTVNIVKDKHETGDPLVDEKPTLILDEFTKHETNQSLVNEKPAFIPIQTRQMKTQAQVRKLVQHDVSDMKKSTENHARKLPQAGAKQSLVPIILGAISTVLATLGLTRRKKNK